MGGICRKATYKKKKVILDTKRTKKESITIQIKNKNPGTKKRIKIKYNEKEKSNKLKNY